METNNTWCTLKDRKLDLFRLAYIFVDRAEWLDVAYIMRCLNPSIKRALRVIEDDLKQEKVQIGFVVSWIINSQDSNRPKPR